MGSSKQYALIAYLAQQEGSSGRLGKKAVQKFFHILSSVSGDGHGYRFSFYTYGPFSGELASDLDIAASLGLISISYDAADNSYSIRDTTQTSKFIDEHLTDGEKKSISNIWEDFSGKSAKELELLSTILFLFDDEKLDADSGEMLNRVIELKPKYTRAEVRQAQELLTGLYSLS